MLNPKAEVDQPGLDRRFRRGIRSCSFLVSLEMEMKGNFKKGFRLCRSSYPRHHIPPVPGSSLSPHKRLEVYSLERGTWGAWNQQRLDFWEQEYLLRQTLVILWIRKAETPALISHSSQEQMYVARPISQLFPVDQIKGRKLPFSEDARQTSGDQPRQKWMTSCHPANFLLSVSSQAAIQGLQKSKMREDKRDLQGSRQKKDNL